MVILWTFIYITGMIGTLVWFYKHALSKNDSDYPVVLMATYVASFFWPAFWTIVVLNKVFLSFHKTMMEKFNDH